MKNNKIFEIKKFKKIKKQRFELWEIKLRVCVLNSVLYVCFLVLTVVPFNIQSYILRHITDQYIRDFQLHQIPTNSIESIQKCINIFNVNDDEMIFTILNSNRFVMLLKILNLLSFMVIYILWYVMFHWYLF